MAQSSGGGNSLVLLGVLAVGGYFVYEWLFGSSTTASAAAPAKGATPATGSGTSSSSGSAPASGASSSAPVVSSSLDKIYQTILTQAAPDPNFTGSGSNLTGSAYHFNVYLQLAAGHLLLPDMAQLFGGVDGASQPMTAAAWWAKVAPAMQTMNAGLAGLGLYGLAGAFFSGARG